MYKGFEYPPFSVFEAKEGVVEEGLSRWGTQKGWSIYNTCHAVSYVFT